MRSIADGDDKIPSTIDDKVIVEEIAVDNMEIACNKITLTLNKSTKA
jgi:hypothetical protein